VPRVPLGMAARYMAAAMGNDTGDPLPGDTGGTPATSGPTVDAPEPADPDAR